MHTQLLLASSSKGSALQYLASKLWVPRFGHLPIVLQCFGDWKYMHCGAYLCTYCDRYPVRVLCAMEAEPDVAKLRDMIQHAKAMADRLEELESQLDTLSSQSTGMCSAYSWSCTGGRTGAHWPQHCPPVATAGLVSCTACMLADLIASCSVCRSCAVAQDSAS